MVVVVDGVYGSPLYTVVVRWVVGAGAGCTVSLLKEQPAAMIVAPSTTKVAIFMIGLPIE